MGKLMKQYIHPVSKRPTPERNGELIDTNANWTKEQSMQKAPSTLQSPAPKDWLA